MFGLSFGEILIILVVALLVLGPSGMPKLARTLGKGLRDFRRATGELRGAFEDEFYKLDQTVEKAVRPEPRGVEGAHLPPVEPAEGIEGVVAASAPEGVEPAAAPGALAATPEGTEPAGATAEAEAPADDEVSAAMARAHTPAEAPAADAPANVAVPTGEPAAANVAVEASDAAPADGDAPEEKVARAAPSGGEGTT